MLQIIGCVFFENNSTTKGGAIYMETNGNSSITKTIFFDKFAENGGTIYLKESQSFMMEITWCDLTENN